MITNAEFSLLALDSYNRGYNAKLNPAGDIVGRFTYFKEMANETESFFASAYKFSDGIVVSYRGTDNPDLNPFTGGKGDISTGWVGGGGTWSSSQFKLAQEFYDQISDLAGGQKIYLTGHSLGGGLAGLVATLRDEKAVVFDNMPYKLAADNAYAVALLASKFENVFAQDIQTLNDALKATTLAVVQMTGDAANFVLSFTNSLNPLATPVPISSDAFKVAKSYFNNGIAMPPAGDIDSFAISGEVLDIVRISSFYGTQYFDGIFGASSRSDFAYSIDIIGSEIGEFIVDGPWSSIKSYFGDRVDAHSMALLTAHMDLDEKVASFKEDVAFLGHALAESTYDEAIAKLTGHEDADKMLTAIAYSTNAQVGAPFGAIAFDAMLSDARDAGQVLDGAEYNWNFRFTWKPNDFLIRANLADAITQFAAELSLNPTASKDLQNGFMAATGIGVTQILSIDYSQRLWAEASRNKGFDTSTILGKDGSNGVLDILDIDGFISGGLFLNNLEQAMKRLYGEASTDVLERVHHIKDTEQPTGVTVDLDAIDRGFTINGVVYASPDTGADFISLTDYDDKVTGSQRSEIIVGGDGSDTLSGGGGDDILVASSNNDDVQYFDGGTGEDIVVFKRDLNDYHITALEGHEYSYLVRELTFFQNPFTPPSFTGNEVYLKNIRSGQFDNNKIYEFDADGPVAEKSLELRNGSSAKIGVLTISAPTYAVDSNVEYTLNLSTSGVGTQYRVALIIDVSGSMRGSRLTEAKAAYADLINYLKAQGLADVTEFAVIPFQSSASLYQGLTADQAIAQIGALNAGGGTSFGPAISRGLEFFGGSKDGVTNIAYFLSDGQGSGANTSLQAVADVRAFGIGSGASITSLNTIDSNTAVILNSASDLAKSFTESEIKTADVDRIEVYLNGVLAETVSGDQLIDNGASGLTFTGLMDGLDKKAADTLEAKVFFKDTTIPAQSLSFEVANGAGDAQGSPGNDTIVFSQSQRAVDAGEGTDTVLANDLDNTIVKTAGNGVIKAFGGNDVVLAGDNRTSNLDRVIDGGDGIDTVVYFGNFAEYTVSRAGGLIKVGTATDSLSNIEFLQFDDARVRTSDLSVVQSVSGADVEVVESNAGTRISFVVSLDAAATGDVSFDYSTANGTAQAGKDFTAISGSATLLTGETQKRFTVDVIGDIDFEADETFVLQLSNLSGAVFQGGNETYSITGTIKNDDEADQVKIGTDKDDTIRTGTGNDNISSGKGNDDVSGNIGRDVISTGAGQDVVRGTLAELDGDVITDFGAMDAIIVSDTGLKRSGLSVEQGTSGAAPTTTLVIDTDKDGASDAQVALEGRFANGEFMAVAKGNDTHITFESFLPALAEKQAIDANLVNGIINQDFLKGDGKTAFKVTLQDLGEAAFDNVLGVYEIGESGAIVDVRILYENTNANNTTATMVADVEQGHKLGFFLVQDAADWAASLKPSDAIGFVNARGKTATVMDGAEISLEINGAAADELVFHSFSESMNVDGLQHSLSGVEIGGEAITVGFEDLKGGGDLDYQDVVFRIELVDDLLLG